jgi:hypothetical protein
MLSAVVYVAFVAWWLSRHFSSELLGSQPILRVYVIACVALVVVWSLGIALRWERSVWRGALGSAGATALLSFLALAAFAIPHAPTEAWCRNARCEDFGGALLFYGWWLAALFVAVAALLVGALARALVGAFRKGSTVDAS